MRGRLRLARPEMVIRPNPLTNGRMFECLDAAELADGRAVRNTPVSARRIGNRRTLGGRRRISRGDEAVGRGNARAETTTGRLNAVRVCGECARSRRPQRSRPRRPGQPVMPYFAKAWMRGNCDRAISRVACSASPTGALTSSRRTGEPATGRPTVKSPKLMARRFAVSVRTAPRPPGALVPFARDHPATAWRSGVGWMFAHPFCKQ